jgi:hypothetical protein
LRIVDDAPGTVHHFVIPAQQLRKALGLWPRVSKQGSHSYHKSEHCTWNTTCAITKTALRYIAIQSVIAMQGLLSPVLPGFSWVASTFL